MVGDIVGLKKGVNVFVAVGETKGVKVSDNVHVDDGAGVSVTVGVPACVGVSDAVNVVLVGTFMTGAVGSSLFGLHDENAMSKKIIAAAYFNLFNFIYKLL
jgi:hypothetical protein